MPRAALVGGGVVAAGAVALTIGLWPAGPGGAGQGEGGRGDSKAPTASATDPHPEDRPPKDRPKPTSSTAYALSKPPSTIPAVREHTPARGPGWRPDGKARVVVGDPGLRDEARLLARELRLRYGGEARPRSGDVHLDLTGDRTPDGTGGRAGDGTQPGPAPGGPGTETGRDTGGDTGPGTGRDTGPGRVGGGAEAGRGPGEGPEAYTLVVKDRAVRITAPTQAGVFHGTRTLKQSVRADGTVPEGVVRDAPAKPRRGFMLDMARKHFSADWIERRIEELGDLKYNELGLHFSDDQAFRIASESHPEVVSADHLTKAQVRRIVDLAASRHITVVPEIDSPGHLGAVLKAHPDLRLRNTRGAVTPGAVDIGNPKAARIVDELLREYAELFPGGRWHIGADEYQALVVRDPEASYPRLAAAARDRLGPGATIQDLATRWLNDRARAVGPARDVRAWNDGFFRGGTVAADDDIEVAYWTGKEIGARDPVEYLREGRDVLNYNDEFLYYVLGEPNDFAYPTGRRIYEQWTPRVLRGTTPVPAAYDGRILGGSFAVWCDLAGAQTQDEVARGIRMPLRATAQKLWDAREPSRSWADFERLAARLDG
ncbi:glycoside hydrolase family 20 protein [Streptomyces sp. CC224B]|uniref:beta-N-acetylhexosaminidase n=1 Tax=Streptomyces sp. CC224B TaxID=3044571 RepID=UPI0024A9F0B0|nr:glycoside hydrolase family 20 protein [Streptomyces sp. CC224B]